MSLIRAYSKIYIEKDAYNFDLTKKVLQHFPNAEIIEIDRYSEVFNRSRQSFREQKQSPQLILAVKHGEFLQPGSPNCQDFGLENFHYTAQILNCLYDCQYCFLQGMFKSAKVVFFVNQDDFLLSAKEATNRLGKLYLSNSYETDLLAWEGVTGLVGSWINLCHQEANLTVECRTKSAAISSLLAYQPPKNFILAWTISPEAIISQYEPLTPKLPARIKALKQSVAHGFNTRIVFDPLINCENFEENYVFLLKELAQQVDLQKIRDFALGTLRISSQYYPAVKEQPVFQGAYQRTNSVIALPQVEAKKLTDFMTDQLVRLGIEKSKIFVWD